MGSYFLVNLRSGATVTVYADEILVYPSPDSFVEFGEEGHTVFTSSTDDILSIKTITED